MTDQTPKQGNFSELEESPEARPLNSSEIEVRLAIADYVIRRVSGTSTGQEIFEALIKRFENRYPHHKLLTHYLINPDFMVPDTEGIEPQLEATRPAVGVFDDQEPPEPDAESGLSFKPRAPQRQQD